MTFLPHSFDRRFFLTLLALLSMCALLGKPANAHGPIVINGSASEWMTGFGAGGCPSLVGFDGDQYFSTTMGCVTSNGAGAEQIWSDNAGDQRTDHWNGTGNLDLRQFRITADRDNLYFLLRFADITNCGAQYIQVAIASTAISSSNTELPDGMETNTQPTRNWFRVVEANTSATGYWTDGATFTSAGSSFCSTTNDLWEIAIPRSAMNMVDLSATFSVSLAVACNNAGVPCETSGSDVMDAMTDTGPNTFNEVSDGTLNFYTNPTLRDVLCASYSFPYTMSSTSQSELVDAIQCANNNGLSADTINLNGQTVSLIAATPFANYSGPTGLPQITSNITIRNGTIFHDMSGGGFLFRTFSIASGGTLNVQNVVFEGASAPTPGGAFHNLGTLNVTNSTMHGYDTNNRGGVLYNGSGSTANFTNALFYNNNAVNAHVMDNLGSVSIINSTFDKHTSISNFGAILEGTGYVVRNSIFWNPGSGPTQIQTGNTVSDSIVKGGYSGGTNILNTSPLFVNEGSNDFRIQLTSPAVNAGNNTYVPLDTTDVDGDSNTSENRPDRDLNPRIVATTVDMGAYERQDALPPDPCLAYTFPYTLTGNTPAELRQAIECANANGTADVINLNAQTVTLTDLFANYSGNTGLPQITTNVTLRNGTITRSGSNLFRMLSVNASGVLSLRGITISNGGGSGYSSLGAGVHNLGTTAVINSNIVNNTGNQAVALYSTNTLNIVNSTIAGNSASTYTAILEMSGTATITNSVISGNRSATSDNIAINSGTLTVTNSTVAYNYAAVSANNASGAFYKFAGATLIVQNSIIWGNRNSTNSADQIEVGSGTPTVSNSIIEGGIFGGINADPLFVTPIAVLSTPTSAGDFQLNSFSPAIDAGANANVPLDTYDVNGNSNTTEEAPDRAAATRRYNDTGVTDTGTGTAPIVDMGAYEKQTNSSIDPCAAITFPYTLPNNAPATLITAMECANANGTADVINLNSQTITLTDSFANYSGATGLPQVTTNVTVRNGTITRTGSNEFRFFHVSNTGNLTVRDMTLTNGGGAAYANDGGTITSGGSSSTLTVINTTISGSRVENLRNASAIYTNATFTIVNSSVVGGGFGRGAIASGNGPALIQNTLIAGNSGPSTINGAGGVYFANMASATIENSTIVGNYTNSSIATQPGGVFASGGTVNLTIRNSIIWGNRNIGNTAPQVVNVTAGTNIVTNSIIEGGSFGALNSDPLFVTPITGSSTPTTAGDFRLSNSSPAIDAGANANVPLDTYDVDGDSNTSEEAVDRALATRRVNDTGVTDTGTGTAPIVDMGAYEKQTSSTPPSVTVTQSGGTTNTTEAGTSDTYSVVLNTQPTADVTISVTGDVDATVSPTTLTFTTVNWNTAQTVTVTAVNDSFAEGAHTGTITHSATGGGYTGVTIASVTANITDNDTAGITFTGVNTGPALLEATGNTNDYTVQLTSIPQNGGNPVNANIAMTVSPDCQISLNGGAFGLSFTISTSALTPNTVSVRAANDLFLEGPQTCAVTYSFSSFDPAYDQLMTPAIARPNDVYNVTDDESGLYGVIVMPGFLASSSGSESTSPATLSAYVTINGTGAGSRLIETPFSVGYGVTGGTATGGGADYTLAAGSVTFNSSTTMSGSNGFETFTISIVNDAFDEPDETIIVTVNPNETGTSGAYDTAITRSTLNPSHTYTILDNDVASITKGTPSTLALNESPFSTVSTTSFSIGATPLGNVSVSIILSSTDDCEISLNGGATWTQGPIFPAFTLTSPAYSGTVSVRAYNDRLLEGAESCLVSYTSTSSDPAYSGLSIASSTFTIADDESATVAFQNSTQTVGEASGTTNQNVVLTITGTGTGTYTLGTGFSVSGVVAATSGTANITADASMSDAIFNFVSGSLNGATDTVAFAVVDDTIDESDEDFALSFDSVINATASGTTTETVTITDNDVTGVSIVELDGSTNVTEAGTTDTYTVVLNTQPTADVTITVTGDAQASASPLTLTFTTVNWNFAQTVTVTAVNDVVAEGAHSGTITHSAAGGGYTGVTIANVTANITDNDTAGVTVTGAPVDVTEAGTTDSYTLTANAQSGDSVTVPVTGDADCLISTNIGGPFAMGPTNVVLNDNTPTTVYVQAVNDRIVEGTHACTITNGTVVSASLAAFVGINPADLTGNITDNDSASYRFAAVTSSIPENAPTAFLNVTTTFSGTGVGTPQFETAINVPYTFTGTATGGGVDYSVSGTVNLDVFGTGLTAVTIIDDPIDEPNETVIAALGTETGGTAAQQAVVTLGSPSTLTLTINDNDVAGVTITESGGSTNLAEDGTTDTYDVVLTSQPSADVTIAVTGDAQLTVSPQTLSFTTVNWATAQTVTVSAVNDQTVEGSPHSGTITHSATGGDYSGASIASVTGAITDNDSATYQFVVSASNANENVGATNIVARTTFTTNGTGTQRFEQAINVPFTIGGASTATGGGVDYSIAGSSIAIPIAGADSAISATIIDDLIDENDETLILTLGAETTSPTLARQDAVVTLGSNATHTLTITDNDAAGVQITQSSGNNSISESGGVDSYGIVLGSEPTATVNVVISFPAAELTVNGDSDGTFNTTFNSSNWDQIQNITLAAANDLVLEGNHNATLSHVFTSSDGSYNGAIASVDGGAPSNTLNVAIADNESAVLEWSLLTGTAAEGASASSAVRLDITANPTGGTPTLEGTLSYSLSLVAGTATAADVGTPVGTLSFSNVSDLATNAISLPHLSDALVEGDEAYFLTIVPDPVPAGMAVTVAPTDFAGTITEASVVSVSIPTATLLVDESASTLNIPVTLNVSPNGALNAAATVTVALNSATAAFNGASGDMYFDVGGTPSASIVVSFPAGSDNGDVINAVVTLVDDQRVESSPLSAPPFNVNEQFSLSLGAATGAVASVSGTTTVDINENDFAYITVNAPSITTNESDGLLNQNLRVLMVTAGSGPQQLQDAVAVPLQNQQIPGAGAATVVVDYDLQTNTVNIPAGALINSLHAFQVAIIDDNISEPQEFGDVGIDVGSYSGVPILVPPQASNNCNAIVNPGLPPNPCRNRMTLRILDNDPPGITVNPTTGLVTSEAGGTATFTVRLNSQPSADVGVGLSSSDSTEGTVGPLSLSFTTGNWNVAQTVTVTGVDDLIVDGSSAYTIITGAATSSDGNYNGVNPSDVNLTNIDNDSAGVLVTQSSGSTAVTEGGNTDSYTVELTSEPTGDVNIVLGVGAQLSLSPPNLIFTSLDWNVAQTVIVTATNDVVVEGPHSANISHSTSSSDSNYSGIPVAGINVAITDNDSAVVQFAPASVSQTEASSPMPFTLTLSNPVASGVSFNVGSLIGTASVADFTPISGTFSFPANNNSPQTINVVINNDALDELDENFTLNLSNLIATGDVSLGSAALATIVDDDITPTLAITSVSAPEGNAGSSVMSFNVSLSSPSGLDVSFSRATADDSAMVADSDYVALAPQTLTIPAGSSSLIIPVTINGDTTFEGNESFTVNLSAISNATLSSISGIGTGTILEDDQEPTTTTITSHTPAPSLVGQPYTVSVNVAAQTQFPTGTVSISDGTASCGPVSLSAATLPNSTASCALTSTSIGSKNLIASYTPADSAFGASSSVGTPHQVNAANTAISVVGPVRSRINQPTTFTFALSVNAPGGGSPAGTVTLSSGATSCSVVVPTSTPSCALNFNALGSRSISATFTPSDANHTASSSSGTSNAQTLVYALSDIAVTKSNAVISYQTGDLLVYTVTVRNLGLDAANNIRLLDNVPAGLNDVVWSCDASGGVSCPQDGGSSNLDVLIGNFPMGALLNYTFYGNVSGSPGQIVNTALVELPLDTTIDDPDLSNNSASDSDVLDDLFQNGFEDPGVNAQSGSYLLPSAALRSALSDTAITVYRLSDANGEALRVYARQIDGELHYALATRNGQARLRLGAWQNHADQLNWTAQTSTRGWVLQDAQLQ